MALEQGESLPPSLSGRPVLGGVWRQLRSLQERSRFNASAVYVALLILLFVRPLARLVQYAVHSDLNSHILLIPFVTAYLLYLERSRSAGTWRSGIFGGVVLGVMGLAIVGASIAWRSSLSVNDGLSLITLGFVSLVVAGGFVFFGSNWIRAHAFPVAFLIFMIPLPDAVVNWLENESMLASAEAAAVFFDLTGTPVARLGTIFELPGIVIRVAQECSGIRSSWVLFISGLMASHLFLRTRWRRILLIAFVIPLGILRNGFRILVIGLLCVHVGPHMIESPIHHQGGPLFFALSLVPLSMLLLWFRRQEQTRTMRTERT